MSEGQILKVYDFNSVGQTEIEFKKSLVDEMDSIPVGIKTPLELSNSGNSGPFVMRNSLGDQIRDNFRNMLSTNHGDRLMLYDFGANLESLVFELGSDGIDLKALNNIKKTTSKYMPFIKLQTFQPTKQSSEMGTGLAYIGILVHYSVPDLNLSNQAVEVILYAGG